MKKNKLSIIFATLTLICIFSVAATANQCGCGAAPIEEKIDTEQTEEATLYETEEEPPEEQTPPEEEEPEEPPEVETPPEEEPQKKSSRTRENL